jgi:hypothetical protein
VLVALETLETLDCHQPVVTAYKPVVYVKKVDAEAYHQNKCICARLALIKGQGRMEEQWFHLENEPEHENSFENTQCKKART